MNKRKLVTECLVSGVLSGIVYLVRKDWSIIGMVDALTIIGICFLIRAMFLTTKKLRFYDLTIYGVKKFVELWKTQPSTIGKYHEYMHTIRHEEQYKESYVVAITLLGVSILAAAILI